VLGVGLRLGVRVRRWDRAKWDWAKWGRTLQQDIQLLLRVGKNVVLFE